ncbi:MAG TPA: hypothetical protein VIK89_04815 [Cytophagaceae bacterium]
MEYRVKEHSFLAAIARRVRKSKAIAMVLGKTIHLSGVDKATFLSNRKWLVHELVHIRQFKQYGYWKFLWLYVVESIKNGYRNNRFEVEARQEAENRVY